jgi:hypothetical protein
MGWTAGGGCGRGAVRLDGDPLDRLDRPGASARLDGFMTSVVDRHGAGRSAAAVGEARWPDPRVRAGTRRDGARVSGKRV